MISFRIMWLITSTSILKNSVIKSVFKKNSKTDKKTYIPVSILPIISKIYERLIYKQVCEFFEPILSKCHCAFHNAHHNTVYLLRLKNKRNVLITKENAQLYSPIYLKLLTAYLTTCY